MKSKTSCMGRWLWHCWRTLGRYEAPQRAIMGFTYCVVTLKLHINQFSYAVHPKEARFGQRRQIRTVSKNRGDTHAI
jgi:hypothetical protein